jgi:hypothetical protein
VPKPSGPACSSCGTLFDWQGRKQSAARLEEAMGVSGFWSNAAKAQATVAELKGVNSILKPLEEALGGGAEIERL